MNPQFSQPKGSVSKETNKDSIARKFGCKKSEVLYAKPGAVLTGYKVIYDKVTQRSYALPSNLPAGATITSLTDGILVHDTGTVDLGALAVLRGEFVTLVENFTSGFTIRVKNEIVSDGTYLYRWAGTLPKDVSAGDTVAGTGAITDATWVLIANTKSLSSNIGATLIKTSRGKTVEAELTQTGVVGDISKKADVASMVSRNNRPHRVIGKKLPQDPTKLYDHFGLMDRKVDGTVYIMTRRGANHLDEGITIYSELLPSGSWSTPVVISQVSGVDCRGGSGGTAPDGSLYAAVAFMVPDSNPNVFMGAAVYTSKNGGVSWTKVNDIPNPTVGGGSAVIPFGKIATIGGNLVIPAYTRDTAYVGTLTYLQSSDNGASWSIGPSILTGTDYNEASILEIGDGIVLCVARTGDGTVQPDGSRRLHQFVSSDGGVNWQDQGQVIGPDAAEEIGWQLVTPALSLVYSIGGTPYVVMTYTARRSGVRYRTCSAARVTAGSGNWSNFATAVNLMSPVETFESGYQTQFVQNNVLFINVFATTVTQSSVSPPPDSHAELYQMPLGDLPDYDSGWFASAINTTYTQNHGFSSIPSRWELEWSIDSIGKSTIISVPFAQRWSGSANQGVGASVQVNPSGFTIRTGAALIPGASFGNPVGTDYNGQFMRIRAWK